MREEFLLKRTRSVVLNLKGGERWEKRGTGEEAIMGKPLEDRGDRGGEDDVNVRQELKWTAGLHRTKRKGGGGGPFF